MIVYFDNDFSVQNYTYYVIGRCTCMKGKNNIVLVWYYVSKIKKPNQQQLKVKGVYLILHVIKGTHVLLAAPLWILN